MAKITILVEGVEYTPMYISGKNSDSNWNGRESKYIKLEMDAAKVASVFRDGVKWSIVEKGEISIVAVDKDGNLIYDEDGNIAMKTTEEYRHEYDNSDFCVLGDIVIHPDGTCTVAMGKETTEEKLITMMYGGVE